MEGTLSIEQKGDFFPTGILPFWYRQKAKVMQEGLRAANPRSFRYIDTLIDCISGRKIEASGNARDSPLPRGVEQGASMDTPGVAL